MSRGDGPTVIEVSSEAGTARVSSRGPVVRIGRAPDNDVVLSHVPTSSRHHAELRLLASGWAVRDVGSHNGTRVNGKLIAVQSDHPVGAADTISIGSAIIRVLPVTEADGMTVEESQLQDVHQLAATLSPREQEVLSLVAAGLTDEQVGTRLYISVKTVHSHLDRIRAKTGVRRRAELTRLAGRLGLLGRHG